MAKSGVGVKRTSVHMPYTVKTQTRYRKQLLRRASSKRVLEAGNVIICSPNISKQKDKKVLPLNISTTEERLEAIYLRGKHPLKED